MSDAPKVPSVDEALNYILYRMRADGPAKYGRHGYDLTVVDLATRYVREMLNERNHPDPVENASVYAVSEPLYDAAWELARRGILRPSPRQSVMQFAAFNATGGGYTLTEAGREWLATISDAKLRLRDPWGPFERP